MTGWPASSAAAAATPSSAASAGLSSWTLSPSRGPRVAEVRHQLEREHLAQLVARVDLVDIELVGHDVAQDLRRVRREEHERARERLAHLDPGFATGGTTERGEPTGQCHLRLELGVDQG